jgi:kojibiose phosphorylase
MAALKLSLNRKEIPLVKQSRESATLKAVIFDMDGVLCDTDRLHYLSWQEALKEYDIPFNVEINHKLRGLTRTTSLDVLLAGRTLPGEQRKKILEEKNQVYISSLVSLSPENLLPGVMRLITEIKQAGLKIGVASASQHVRRVLEQLGIANDIQVIADGVNVQNSKPAPDPYLYVAYHLGIHPQYCLAIEDSLSGIKSAHQAGMCVVGVGKGRHLADADFQCPSIDKLNLEILEKIHEKFAD